MALNTRFRKGTYLAVCDVCGFTYNSDELRMRWDDLLVCKQDWEPRHPSDFFNPNLEEAIPEITRPEQADIFIAGPVCTIEQRSGVAGVGAAGCSQVGFYPILS